MYFKLWHASNFILKNCIEFQLCQNMKAHQTQSLQYSFAYLQFWANTYGTPNTHRVAG